MDDAAAGERGFKGGERRGEFGDAAGDLGLRRHVHVVFGEVDAGFEQRDQLDQRLLDGRDATAERAAHLAGGLARLRECLRIDQVAHRFSLGEVEPAGEKSPLGKLAGLGHPRAERERAAQQKFEHHRRAVRGDLDEIFRGVRVGRAEKGDQSFVDTAELRGLVGRRDVCQSRASVFERLPQFDEFAAIDAAWGR